MHPADIINIAIDLVIIVALVYVLLTSQKGR